MGRNHADEINKASHSLVYDRFMFVGSKFDVGVYI